MKIGVIGSGPVALTISEKLLEKGNEVMVSSRNLNQAKDKGQMGKYPSPNEWKILQVKKGLKAFVGSFEDAAKFGEVVFNCTPGEISLKALEMAGKKNLNGKILVDVGNPLDFSKGMPPTLTFCNTESLGERIQSTYPAVKVVKALNTVSAPVMVNPSLVPGESDLLIAGNDAKAKEWVKETLLKNWFGWKSVIDLGDITAARASEMYLPLWLRLFGKIQSPFFNIKVVKK